jgi:hypothetical protein
VEALILISVELTALFLIAKNFRKLPNPFSIVTKRIENWQSRVQMDFITSIIEGMQKDPEAPKILAALLDKPARILMDGLVKNPPGGLGKIVDMQSTGNLLLDGAQVILPMFGAKGRMIAQGLPLLRNYKGLPGNKQEGNASGKNPFDR